MHIKARGRSVVLRTSNINQHLKELRGIPGKKRWEGSVLIFEPTAPALDYVRRIFPTAEWDEGALKFCRVADNMRAAALPAQAPRNVDYIYRTKPFEHQDMVFKASRDREKFALLMEQGTGKTKVILDTAAYLYAKGDITGVLVIAKNGVHRNWIDKEIPEHLPEFCQPKMAFWTAQKGERGIKAVYDKRPGLAILTVNVEALSTKRGEKICEEFLLTYSSIIVVDESTCIKTPGAKRTKAVLRLSSYSRFRRILTGTPITKGPLDAYAQFSFLDEDILGFSSFYSFRARYAVLQNLPGKVYRGRPVQFVVGYQNLDELQAKIKEHSYRVLKKECLDLPEKLYQRRFFQISEEQRKHYDDFVDTVQTEFRGARLSAPLVMTRILRLHQISCGFLPDPETQIDMPIGEVNPRLVALMDELEESEGKVIIYANYKFNLREIWKAVTDKYGKDSAVAYSGDVKKSDMRAEAIRRFQDPQDPAKYFIGQTEAAGYGLTLTEAQKVVYYSNNFKLEVRQQSEDRPHRIGQKNNVLYVDIQAEDTVDGHIIDTLRKNYEVATAITGDKLLDWLT